MTRKLLLWTFVILVPLLNLRMICFDHQARARSAGMSASGECDEFCPRDAAPARDANPPAGCLLVAGGCSAVAAFGVALPPPAATRLIAATASPYTPTVAVDIYRAPASPPFSPPPEA